MTMDERTEVRKNLVTSVKDVTIEKALFLSKEVTIMQRKVRFYNIDDLEKVTYRFGQGMCEKLDSILFNTKEGEVPIFGIELKVIKEQWEWGTSITSMLMNIRRSGGVYLDVPAKTSEDEFILMVLDKMGGLTKKRR